MAMARAVPKVIPVLTISFLVSIVNPLCQRTLRQKIT
jgi:hypothetical protein